MQLALVKPVVAFIQTYTILSALSPPPSPPISTQDRERQWPTGLKYGAVLLIRSFRPITKVCSLICSYHKILTEPMVARVHLQFPD
jgi:hypothetical protein